MKAREKENVREAHKDDNSDVPTSLVMMIFYVLHNKRT